MVEGVEIELIDLGTNPLRIGGVKAYETNGEEVMIEVPISWGSNARVRVSARLGFAGYAVNIPVEVRDIQVTAAPTAAPWAPEHASQTADTQEVLGSHSCANLKSLLTDCFQHVS